MILVETPIFTRQVQATLPDEDYRLLQTHLIENPAAGKLIPGGGGLRKVRWSGSGRGKRGGTRVIYYWATAKGEILLLFMYPKNVMDDLTPSQLATLRRLIKDEYP